MNTRNRAGWVVLVGLSLTLFCGAAHAEFRAYWTSPSPLGVEAKKPSNPWKLQGLLDPAGVPGRTPSEMPRQSRTGFGFADWRNHVNAAAGDLGGAGDEPVDFRYTAGIPFLSPALFAWTKASGNGYHGIGWTIGYYNKSYFNPMRRHAWNTFWHWGTAYLIIPYIGVGTEYMTSNFYFEVGTFYILPYIGAGFHF